MPGCGSGVGVCGRAAHSLSIAATTIVARHQGAAVVAHAEHSHSLEEEELRSVAWGGRVGVHGKVAGRVCGWGEGSIARQQAACPNLPVNLKSTSMHSEYAPLATAGAKGSGEDGGSTHTLGGRFVAIKIGKNRKAPPRRNFLQP